MVNALHERFGGFLWRFKGVSTRHPRRYPWWFCWEEQARGRTRRAGRCCAPLGERGILVAPSRPRGRGPAVLGLLEGPVDVNRIQLGLKEV